MLLAMTTLNVIGASRSVYCHSQAVVCWWLIYPPGFVLLSFVTVASFNFLSFDFSFSNNNGAECESSEKEASQNSKLNLHTESQVSGARAPIPVNTDTNELIQLAASILASTILSPGHFSKRCYDSNDTRRKERPTKVDITNFNVAGRS